tara:strand:+ start:2176 stop:2628 length:453 start_codon:yes stop_codon:yes gene_type:complete
MATLRYQACGHVVIDGVLKRFGKPSDDYTVTGVTKSIERILPVGTSTTVKLWDVTVDFAFKFFFVQTDYDVHIEFVTDDDASIGEVAATKYLTGSGKDSILGPPMILTSNTSYANYTVNFGGGTINTIDTIRVRNLSTTDAAQVHAFVAG